MSGGVFGVCLSCGRRTYKGSIKCHLCKKRVKDRDWFRVNRKRKPRAKKCYVCGTSRAIGPFTGLCPKHYRQTRKI